MITKYTMKYPAGWHGQMWREAAPCGSGLIGAAVYGGVKKELIMLNHACLWRGSKTAELPDIHHKLSDIREHLAQNDPASADTVISKTLSDCDYDGATARPLPLCDIVIRSDSEQVFSHYRREVDMHSAQVNVSWEEEGVAYRRSVFVSRINHLVFTRISCSKPLIDLSLEVLQHESEGESFTLQNKVQFAKDNHIFFAAYNQSEFSGGDFGAVTQVSGDGTLQVKDGALHVSRASEVLLVTRLFVKSDRELEFGKPFPPYKSYEEELLEHTRAHSTLFDRVDFTISDQEANTSNEELLMEAFDERASNELLEKLYAFGRYLLICSTGEKDTLPCHLTGLWNGSYNCFWAFYMYNINFQMIYWQALTGGLPELLRLALDYTESFTADFQENAKKLFGCRGILINSVNTPESGIAKCMGNHILNWTAGAAWISQHFWDYYCYTEDLNYLKIHALPFMAEAAQFYEDFLTEDAQGFLCFSPSVSPENTAANVFAETKREVETCVNATMDIAAVKELLTNLIQGSKLTGLYGEKIEAWKSILDKLPPYAVNADGAIREWTHDYYEDNYHHRHHSHLYPVFPGREVKPGHTLYPAFERAEELRLQNGLSDQSSWSMVFMACVAARMHNGERALHVLEVLAKSCLMNNLFTVHNDWRRMGPVYCRDFQVAPFQIDGNIGIPAAIHELLLQADGDSLVLLPALPQKWKNGKMTGLTAPGNVSCDLFWDEKEIRAILHSTGEKERSVQYKEKLQTITFSGSKELVFAR